MKTVTLLLLGAQLAGMAAQAAPAPRVVIGSKAFNESVILADIAADRVRATGARVRLRLQLGGTRVLWSALRRGDIDVYPEYTGTLRREILAGQTVAPGLAGLRAALRGTGIRIGPPLGFTDGYALAMRARQAQRLGIRTIGDLRDHPDLRYAFSNEFRDRDDGWKGLRRTYDLAPNRVTGMAHALAYRAIASGAADVIDVYTTDAEIDRDHLRLLRDPRHFFPDYRAVWLYRADLARRAPAAVAALNALGGQIDTRTMRRMNAAVLLHGRSASAVAAQFSGTAAPPRAGLVMRVLRRTGQHFVLVGWSLLAAILVAIPLGIAASRRPHLGRVILAVASVLQTLPSLALLVLLIPLLGIGAPPALAALFLYSLLPIVRNTHAGLSGIPPDLRLSAAVLGLPARTRLWRIELPLAWPSILAGIQTSAVINVGTATLAALVGAGGYGQPILTGIRLDSMATIAEGAVPAAVMALVVSALFELLGRWTVPRRLHSRGQVH